jgi:EAL domain-containing protein (putative c-di-GMP-specific phosphodiesterase class I)
MKSSFVGPSASFEQISAGLTRDAGHWTVKAGELLMRSSFQPIYSLPHRRVVGHEALLRAEDAAGHAVQPPLALRGDGSFTDVLRADRSARLIHSLNFAEMAPPNHWLFFNMQPQVFVVLSQVAQDGFQRKLLQRCRLHGHQLVLEVLEEAVPDSADFEGAVRMARASGCLIALDDFGAGHSNFDRVWQLQPEIVKLDLSLVRRAALHAQSLRVVTHMVSLLHQCGALVLMEGIESQEEAFVALEADADLVQGDLFARPAPDLVAAGDAPLALSTLWDDYEGRRAAAQRSYDERLKPYIAAVGAGSVLMAKGRPLTEATRTFLQLPRAELCYLLDGDARQVGENVWAPRPARAEPPAFAPLRNADGAHWARRPYYRRAMARVGEVQVTRPYRTLHGAHMCVTVSVAFRCAEGLRVICGDLAWEGDSP